jgi:hypothetical protein
MISHKHIHTYRMYIHSYVHTHKYACTCLHVHLHMCRRRPSDSLLDSNDSTAKEVCIHIYTDINDVMPAEEVFICIRTHVHMRNFVQFPHGCTLSHSFSLSLARALVLSLSLSLRWTSLMQLTTQPPSTPKVSLQVHTQTHTHI